PFLYNRKWYIVVYGPVQMVVPEYQDPALNQKEPYDTAECEAEALLPASVNQPKDEVAGIYIKEENARWRLALEHPGKIFLFYKSKYIVVTDELSQIPLNREEFDRIPSLLRQLNEDQIVTVGQLPTKLVILAKYGNVGIGTLKKRFDSWGRKPDTGSQVFILQMKSSLR